MTGHMTSRTKAGAFAVFAFVTLTLAGCGNHDQAGTSSSSGTMTPAQIQENAKRQNESPKSGAGQGTPPVTAAHP